MNVFYKGIDFKEITDKKAYLDTKRPLPYYALSSLIKDIELKMIYNSNAIEGNTLTLSETKVVLENSLTIGGKTLKEHFEVINHKDAIDFINSLVKQKKQLSEYEIRQIHYFILKNIDNENAGKYREENVLISGAIHRPPIFSSVPALMEELMNTYHNEWDKLHPIARSCFLHGEFVKIHPFVDGNGRTARLLMNFELIKNGYVPIVIKNNNKTKYYTALDKGAISNDYTDFVKLALSYENESIDYYLSICGNEKEREDHPLQR